MTWFDKKWLDLKASMVSFVTKEVYENYDLLVQDNGPHQLAEEVIYSLYAISQSNQSGKWDAGLALLSNLSQFLTQFIARNKNALNSDHAKSYFGQSIKQYLEDQRRELAALDLSEDWSASKIKTWERLQRISNTVAQQQNEQDLCSERHFENVLKYISENHSADYNYPHKISTIRAYFFKLSSRCKEVVFLGSDLEDYVAGGTVDVLSEVLLGNNEKKVLFEALSELNEDHYEVINIEFKLELNKAFPLTKKDFRERKGLSHKAYQELKLTALDELSKVFQRKYLG